MTIKVLNFIQASFQARQNRNEAISPFVPQGMPLTRCWFVNEKASVGIFPVDGSTFIVRIYHEKSIGCRVLHRVFLKALDFSPLVPLLGRGIGKTELLHGFSGQ
jgi:hypothetical protein